VGEDLDLDELLAKMAIPRASQRRCSFAGCRTLLTSSNRSPMCYRHAQIEHTRKLEASCNQSESADPLPPRLCAKAGCATQITQWNRSGYCGTHIPRSNTRRMDKMNTEDRTPMSTGADRRCAVEGCNNPITNYNKTGRCVKHWYLKVGERLKDGSVPRPHGVYKTRTPPPAVPVDVQALVGTLSQMLMQLGVSDRVQVTEVQK
jgi:hypothetical protein